MDDEDHAELLDRQVRGRARRAAAFINAEAVSLVSSNAHESARPDTAIDVDNAMSDLPPEQREAVALVLVEGLAYREAAEILEIPVGTLLSRLARGRKALALKLEAA